MDQTMRGLKNRYNGCILKLTYTQPMEEKKMESLKDEAISAISKMPESADIDEIMYRLYVIDKVRKGREAVVRGEVLSAEDLKREIESW
jgi:hypothetical protein